MPFGSTYKCLFASVLVNVAKPFLAFLVQAELSFEEAFTEADNELHVLFQVKVMIENIEPFLVGESYLPDQISALLRLELNFGRLLAEQEIEMKLETKENSNSCKE